MLEQGRRLGMLLVEITLAMLDTWAYFLHFLRERGRGALLGYFLMAASSMLTGFTSHFWWLGLIGAFASIFWFPTFIWSIDHLHRERPRTIGNLLRTLIGR